LAARVLGIADVFDALLTRSNSLHSALCTIRASSGNSASASTIAVLHIPLNPATDSE
jgi:HD-GYP domain-containing protein (c-di-GMP phosphodiesterase class II)